MVAGNAIERVYKNINEIRNFMLDEYHFPYVVFLQGSNFATRDHPELILLIYQFLLTFWVQFHRHHGKQKRHHSSFQPDFSKIL